MAMLPIPPVEERTIRVNDARSTSRIRRSERLMLSTSYFHHMMPHHLSMVKSNIVSMFLHNKQTAWMCIEARTYNIVSLGLYPHWAPSSVPLGL